MRITDTIKNLKIKLKISIFALLSITISILAIAYISYNHSSEVIKESIIKNLDEVSKFKADKIEAIYRTLKKDVEVGKESPIIRENFGILAANVQQPESDQFMLATEEVNKAMVKFREVYKFDDIQLVDDQNTVIYYTSKRHSGKHIGNEFKHVNFEKVSRQNFVEAGQIFKDGSDFFFYVYAPIMDTTFNPVGTFVCKYNVKTIYNILNNYDGLGETGETYIAERRGEEALYLNSFRHGQNSALMKSVDMDGDIGLPMIDAVRGHNSNGLDVDYRGEEVIASWRYLPNLNWGLVTKIDVKEAHLPITELQEKLIFLIIIILLITLLLVWLFSKSVTDPILNLEKTVIAMGKGNLPAPIEVHSQDEIGLMTAATNNLVAALKDTAVFAGKIGENQLDAQYTPLSDDDLLGNSLLRMRDSLAEARAIEQKRAHEDQKRNWAIQGFAQFGDILRDQNTNDGFADILISTLTKYMEANQGAIYEINKDNGDDQYLELIGCYAWNRKKYMGHSIKMGEGLAGQCWQENQSIYLTDVPDGYVRITSGLGEANPTSILIVPLKINDETYGVVEIASFKEFEDYQIDFVEQLGESIASSMANYKTNQQTSHLFEESKEMTEELRAQEEEMRQNMEEMQATQEEMMKVTEEKNRIIVELKKKLEEK